MAKREYEAPMNNSAHNVIAGGTTIKGDVSSEENFRIDGSLEGTIKCKGKIVVGPQSTITGDIECLNIEVMGSINGNVKCNDTLILRATARVNGDMTVKVLQVEPGAQFNGSNTMIKLGGLSTEKK